MRPALRRGHAALTRSMAHKIDLQLTHRGAARSVSGMASMLAHEIKNPLVRHQGCRTIAGTRARQ